jgi:hypothetical protein
MIPPRVIALGNGVVDGARLINASLIWPGQDASGAVAVVSAEHKGAVRILIESNVSALAIEHDEPLVFPGRYAFYIKQNDVPFGVPIHTPRLWSVFTHRERFAIWLKPTKYAPNSDAYPRVVAWLIEILHANGDSASALIVPGHAQILSPGQTADFCFDSKSMEPETKPTNRRVEGSYRLEVPRGTTTSAVRAAFKPRRPLICEPLKSLRWTGVSHSRLRVVVQYEPPRSRGSIQNVDTIVERAAFKLKAKWKRVEK